MSLYGVLRTGVSGLTAQANKLGTVGDNIANANTTGYKRSSIEFSSLVVGEASDSYNSGGVTSDVRFAISQGGSLLPTTSTTDLAVDGDGFFVVSDGAGASFLTRAGSFVPDGTGRLVNAAGYKLMGFPVTDGATDLVANGLAGLQEIDVTQARLDATPSSDGRLFANLPENAPVGPGPTTSLLAYDGVGNEVLLDIQFTKTAADTWEIAVFDKATGAPLGSAAPLVFDSATGDLTTTPPGISVPMPNGVDTIELDLSQMTHLAEDFTIMAADVDGSAPSAVASVEITEDGTLLALMENGARLPYFTIPLADVPSPDMLRPITGNVYVPTSDSGDVRVGTAGSGGFGDIVSNALEQSNVDMASELVSMIEAQRGYTANSKVFQTGAELLDVLINLKR